MTPTDALLILMEAMASIASDEQTEAQDLDNKECQRGWDDCAAEHAKIARAAIAEISDLKVMS